MGKQNKTNIFKAAMGSMALAGLLMGCAGSVQAPTHPQRAEARAEALYAGALADALSVYEAELRQANRQWYPTYTEAYSRAQDLIEPDLSEVVRQAVNARGRSMADLNAWAQAHPEFVRAQNQAFEERIAELAPQAYAVMGRIDTRRAPPRLELPEAASEQTEALAAR